MCPPLICSFGRPVDLERGRLPEGGVQQRALPLQHLDAPGVLLREWGEQHPRQFNCIGRIGWDEKQCRQNMWTRRATTWPSACSCRCGQGPLEEKDTDWYQVKRMQDEKKEEVCSGRTGRPPGEAAEAKKSAGPQTSPRRLSHDLPARHSMDRSSRRRQWVPQPTVPVPRWLPGPVPTTGFLHPLSPALQRPPLLQIPRGVLRTPSIWNFTRATQAGGPCVQEMPADYSPAVLAEVLGDTSDTKCSSFGEAGPPRTPHSHPQGIN